MSDETLIPISMINTVMYCPRRFHYEFVQGEWAENEHTVAGKIKHQRTDQPSQNRSEGDRTVTRRQYIASEKLGVAGYLDLLEEKDGDVYPVEYKKGKSGVWLNDRIQLCLQGMVLEELLSRKIDYGYIYYITSRRRRKIEFSDELRSQTTDAVEMARRIASCETPPTPVHDNRCNGCSIRDICLPDEIGYLTREIDKPPRCKLAPGMERVLYIDTDGAILRRTGERLLVVFEGETIRDIPIIHVDEIVIGAGVSLTTPVMQWLMYERIPVIFLSRFGRFQGTLTPAISKNSLLRMKQHQLISDEDACLRIARRIVMGKLTNMKVVIQRRARSRKNERFATVIKRISDRIKSAEKAKSLDELLGIEGIGTRDYFDVFDLLMNKNVEFSFDKRTRRPPKDPVNSLLSFAYTLLVGEMISAIQAVGLDPYFGFYHQLRYGRPCLALDLMEEFRTSVADLVVLSLVNKHQVTMGDFSESSGGWFLRDKARKAFYAEYERRKNQRITHPIFEYKITYRQAMELQARLMAKVIIGEIDDYVPLTLR